MMKLKWIGMILVLLFPQLVLAQSEAVQTDPASSIIFWGTLILFFGILGRYVAKRVGQPGVLGELLMGVLIGNGCYWGGMQLMVILRDSTAVFSVIQQMLSGVSLSEAAHIAIPDAGFAKQVIKAMSGPNGNQWITITFVVDALSRYGVIFLLFMVGLESSLEDLKKTGKESIRVAIIGVFAPIVLGLLLMKFILPQGSFSTALFVAAALSATSVGITARVLQDMNKLNTREARTILGAAMIDDVLGLVILAVVSAMVVCGHINIFIVARILFFAVIFFPLALWIGPTMLRKMITFVSFVDPWEAKLLASFIFVMCFSWLATLVHMSTIIGAFVAGIILHEGFFESRERELKNPLSIKNLLTPFESIFAPLFFMLIGIQVRLETFLDWNVLIFAGCLIVAAILGKLLSGLGGSRKDDRMLIGIGMLPRGEVGLVFASVGKTMGVIPEALFSAVVLMVVVTTFVTPIWMKLQYKGYNKKVVRKS